MRRKAEYPVLFMILKSKAPALLKAGRRRGKGRVKWSGSYWFTPLARKPPSTTSTSPVTKEALSELR